MIQRLRERSRSESGFTLVELLVVMLILALLAAIAIPSFFNQRDKARDAEAKASVRTAQTAMETYATDNNGSYSNASEARLVALEDTLTGVTQPDARLSVSNLGDRQYTVTVVSRTGTGFSITRANTGVTSNTCTAPEEGGCPAGGRWD